MGHIEGLYYIFEYIRKHAMSRAVFDLFQPKVDESEFTSGTMKCNDFYGDTEEYLLPGML